LNIRINSGRSAFSLVELLLTLVLILCLAAASVFTFTAIFRSANLDEGFDRFQSLIRFAQAEAATTGRKVRLQFEPDSVASAAGDRSELRAIRVTWEADLLNSPGVFQAYTNKGWSEDMVNELVGIEKVQPIRSPNAPQSSVPAESESDETLEDIFELEDFPSITFYPDGSCDSAEIVLASRNADDDRRLAVRLSGLLGSVSSRSVASADEDSPDSVQSEEYDAALDAWFSEGDEVSAADATQ
jgi:type II secretory pathway pseudopilin PulG